MIKKIALDSMCFIYHFEQTQPYFGGVENILTQAQAGKFEIVTSVISVLETLSSPKYLNQTEIINEVNLLFSEANCINTINVDWDISQEAAKLRRNNKFLRVPDSIQLATAILQKAEVFITNDDQLVKLQIPGLKISSLSKDL